MSNEGLPIQHFLQYRAACRYPETSCLRRNSHRCLLVLPGQPNGHRAKHHSRVTEGKGAERVIIAMGNKSSIEIAIETTSIPGECFQVGVPIAGNKICVDGHALMHKRNLSGSLGGGTFPDRDIPAYMGLNDRGEINAGKMITNVLPFKKINQIYSII